MTKEKVTLPWKVVAGQEALFITWVRKTAFAQPLLSEEPPPSPLSSRAKPRDLWFSGPLLEMFFDRVVMCLRPTQGDEKLLLLVLLSVPNRIVIPTEAKRSGGTCCSHQSSHLTLNGSVALPFVIPTEA
jgi:hypothetical protein